MTNHDKILKFIGRFQNGGATKTFTEGCCYYFAAILRLRGFDGYIVYNEIDNHFAFKCCNKLYDITGEITDTEAIKNFVSWDTYVSVEPKNAARVMRDCILF